MQPLRVGDVPLLIMIDGEAEGPAPAIQIPT